MRFIYCKHGLCKLQDSYVYSSHDQNTNRMHVRNLMRTDHAMEYMLYIMSNVYDEGGQMSQASQNTIGFHRWSLGIYGVFK